MDAIVNVAQISLAVMQFSVAAALMVHCDRRYAATNVGLVARMASAEARFDSRFDEQENLK